MSDRLDEQRVGFIGAGAMASALARGLVATGTPGAHICASDPIAAQRDAFAAAVDGAKTTADNADVVAASDLVLLAVKPEYVEAILAGVQDAAAEARPLWISIAAGVRLARLVAPLPDGARVVRAMPNTPALVASGATAFVANPCATDADRAAAHALFSAVGTCWEAPNEGMLDAVTGLSGSGPAYVFLMLEALSDAGVREGLPRDAATQLAAQTVFGAARLALESGRHPAALKDEVTSPGGTTIAGLEQLEAGGVRAALYDAVSAATRRSRELGGG